MHKVLVALDLGCLVNGVVLTWLVLFERIPKSQLEIAYVFNGFSFAFAFILTISGLLNWPRSADENDGPAEQ